MTATDLRSPSQGTMQPSDPTEIMGPGSFVYPISSSFYSTGQYNMGFKIGYAGKKISYNNPGFIYAMAFNGSFNMELNNVPGCE